MRLVYGTIIFLNSFLLFLVQPLIAKRLLPTFGGSPLVWNTCLLFFQFVLLLGYLYAHLSFKWAGNKKQPWLHGIVLLLPLLALPIAMPGALVSTYEHALATAPDSFLAQPAVMVLAMLFASVGLPFFALSGGAPVIQRWFSHTNDPRAHDPYFLYQASNLGSMLALLGYPAIFEREFGLGEQSRWWSYGYAALILLIGGALWVSRGHWAAVQDDEPKEHTPAPEWRQRALWVALSAGPSALLLAVTTYLTTNVAPMPLLWVAPLALYLITFIIAFASKPLVPPKLTRFLACLSLVPVLATLYMVRIFPIGFMVSAHLFSFFLVALASHTEIGLSRPKADHLTEFYLWISVGGVLGGLFSAIVAPLAFTTLAEYPVALVVCFAAVGLALKPKKSLLLDVAVPVLGTGLTLWLAVHFKGTNEQYDWVYPAAFAMALSMPRPVRFAATLALMCIGLRYVSAPYAHIFEERSFFGVHFVQSEQAGNFHLLMNGTTNHGAQFRDQRRRVPITYYSEFSGISKAVSGLEKAGTQHDIAVVGLGTGTMAAYGKPGERIDFYEIDPNIERIARNPALFTYVTDSRAQVKVLLGDARLRIVEARPQQYDLIALDAFASDAIPVHLMTVEAFESYVRALKPRGILAVHVSNRYLELRPVVSSIATRLGLKCLDCDDSSIDDARKEMANNASDWVLVGRPEAMKLFSSDKALTPLTPEPGFRVWTDEYSNVMSAMRVFRQHAD